MKMKLPFVLVLLMAINGCLGFALVWRLVQGSQRSALTNVDSTKAPTAVSGFDVPTMAAIDSIQSRAIFHKSRRFYVAPPPQISVLPPPDYRLAGSMSIPGKQSAVLVHSSTGTRTRVSVGDQVAGWTVALIEPTKVTMRSGDRAVEITSSATRAPSAGVTLIGAQASNSGPPTH